MQQRLGIIVGSGKLPQKIIKACLQQKQAFCIVVIENQFDINNLPPDIPFIKLRLGAGGSAIRFFKEQNVDNILLAGGVKRPSLASLRPDAWSTKILRRFGYRKMGGDNRLLTIVTQALEEEGFKVIGAHEIVPELLTSWGILGHIAPSYKISHDIEKAFNIAKKIGELDIGQGCVVNEGHVIAVEALEGTDKMLKRVADMKDQTQGGVLLKALKPGQERRVDMPTIGIRTLYNVKKAGLKGIALEAGSTLLLEPEEVIKKADELGIFLMGVKEEDFIKGLLLPKRIYLIAGEASGDKLGASLMENLQKRYKDQFQFIGIGGPLMQKQGLSSLFPMEDLSMMGVAAVLAELPKLIKRIRQTVDHILQIEPDMVITIDSPGFNKKVAAQIKKKNPSIPLVHWVAPSVWAWRPNRAKKMAKLFDYLLCLLPFEPPYFEKEGLKTYVTGHPITALGADKGDGVAFREKYNIDPNTILLTLLPGSRMSEVRHLLPIYKDALDLLYKKYPDIHLAVPLASAVAEKVKAEIQQWPMNVTFIEDENEKYDCFAASNVALTTSGTVTLELAMARVPMVIAYTFGWLSDIIAERIVKIKRFSLISILQDKELMPEFMASNCRAESLYQTLDEFISHKKTPDFDAWEQSLVQLGLGQNSGDKAAEIVYEIFSNIMVGEENEISVSSCND